MGSPFDSIVMYLNRIELSARWAFESVHMRLNQGLRPWVLELLTRSAGRKIGVSDQFP